MSGSRLIPLPELATRWGWKQGKLYRLVEAKAIPHVCIQRRYYFEEDAIEAWLAAQRVPDTRHATKAAPVSRMVDALANEPGADRYAN